MRQLWWEYWLTVITQPSQLTAVGDSHKNHKLTVDSGRAFAKTLGLAFHEGREESVLEVENGEQQPRRLDEDGAAHLQIFSNPSPLLRKSAL